MASVNPRFTFCFLSGPGADSAEKSRVLFARVKGRTENALFRARLSGHLLVSPGLHPAGRPDPPRGPPRRAGRAAAAARQPAILGPDRRARARHDRTSRVMARRRASSTTRRPPGHRAQHGAHPCTPCIDPRGYDASDMSLGTHPARRDDRRPGQRSARPDVRDRGAAHGLSRPHVFARPRHADRPGRRPRGHGAASTISTRCARSPRGVDVVTFEFENVPAASVAAVAELVPVRPAGSGAAHDAAPRARKDVSREGRFAGHAVRAGRFRCGLSTPRSRGSAARRC